MSPLGLLIADGARLHMALIYECRLAGLYRDVNGAVFASCLSRYAGFRHACAALGTEPKKAPYAITGVILCAAHKVCGAWMIVRVIYFFFLICLFSTCIFSLSSTGLLKTALRNLRNGALSNEHAGIHSTVDSCDGSMLTYRC